MRLSTRIALWAAAVVPLLVVLAGLLLLPLVGRDLRHQQDARLNDRAAALLPGVRALVAADSKGRPKVEQNQQRKVVDAALDLGVRVTGADGTVLLSVGPQPDGPGAFPAVPGGPVTVREHGTAWRVLTVAVTTAGGTNGGTGAGVNGGAGLLWVVTPTGPADREAAVVRRRVLLVALVSAPVSAVIGFALAERATAPLRRLSRRAAVLDPAAPAPSGGTGPADGSAGRPVGGSTGGPGDGPGGHGFAAERTGTTEVDELSAALALLLTRYDEQARRTAQALDTARSFSADASHELRTPLMSLRTNLDVLAAHPDLSATDRAEIVAELGEDHTRLLDLLTALSTLARGDLVQLDAFHPVDLAELVDAAADEARRRHPGAGFTVDAPEEMRVFGWESGLRIMLANLLGNAAVHGRTGHAPARVTVRLAAEGAVARLTVDDTGPGVRPEDRETVFQRFHRRRDSPGSGLGLTLVAQQAALHRGTVGITTPPGGTGCRVEVTLPLPRPDAPTVELPARRDWIAARSR
ncbi:HAMP domain-containing sensor histidine kinase [Kitasatospora sp. CM 4170]|uniref:histidine kinase n=1 Tax=Kitasatospora aburaviensis TaxID=67265 RepID=A0ABW1F9Y5_9ACTN|nr:HAMP domain-containing sensor histidine kinase [Kitasatospora sp. CM 4170]WNM43601.1 HAMP domain-containing sensor histidine kinase [Kitasatospora sp. CM 4170]